MKVLAKTDDRILILDKDTYKIIQKHKVVFATQSISAAYFLMQKGLKI